MCLDQPSIGPTLLLMLSVSVALRERPTFSRVGCVPKNGSLGSIGRSTWRRAAFSVSWLVF